MQFTVKPLMEGASYTAFVTDGNGERDIALTQSGDNYTATVAVPADSSVWFTVKAEKNGASAETDTCVTRYTGTENVFVGEEDTRTYAVLSSESEAGFSLAKTFDSVQPESGYYSVSPVTGLSATAAATGKIYSSAAMESDIDQSSLRWYYNNGSSWQALTSDVTVSVDSKGQTCASASADYAGNGLYCLAAKKSDTTTIIAAVSNVTATCDSTTGYVTLHFDDSNPSFYDTSTEQADYTTAGKVRYYDVYYSTKNDFNLNDSSVISRRYTAGEDITLAVDEPGKDYYFRVTAISNSGAVSAPSSAVKLSIPLPDRDSDGIPDEYCDTYGLWGWSSEDNMQIEKDIANADEDGDGLNNLEEYSRGTNPILRDTDGDGVEDGLEIAKGLDPTNPMTDGTTSDYVRAFGAPDLAIDADCVDVSPLHYEMNNEVSVKLNVRNLSDAHSPDVHVTAECDGQILDEWMVSVLGKDQVSIETTLIAPSDGSLTFYVDKEHEGFDSDYSNNTYTFVPLSEENAALVQNVVNAIDAIPDAVTEDDYDTVTHAYSLYNALSDELRPYVRSSYVDKLMVAYDVVVTASYHFSDEVIDTVANKMFDFTGTSVDLSSYNLECDAHLLEALLNAVQSKYPAEYDVARLSNYSYSYRNGKLTGMSFSYYENQSVADFNAKVSALKNAIQKVCSKFTGKSDFEKVVAVHDYLILNGEYDESLTKFTAYAMLVQKAGVCQAYTNAYQLIMNAMDIPCVSVSSSNMNHTWNLVKLGESWYHVDNTWDDPIPDRDGESQYTYLLLNDNEMKEKGHYDWISPVMTSGGEFVAMPRTNNHQQYLYKNRWYFYDAETGELVSTDIYGGDRQTLCTDATGGVVVYDDIVYYGSGRSIKKLSLGAEESTAFYELSTDEGGNPPSGLSSFNLTYLDLDENAIVRETLNK